MSEAAPAFQFYAQDFLTGTLALSLSARGAYITLLAYQWDHGSVPADLAEIGRICGCAKTEASKAWMAIAHKFQPGPDGGWQNLRLERQRATQAAYREQQSQRGQAGAKARWDGNGGGNGGGMPAPMPAPMPDGCLEDNRRIALRTSSSSSSSYVVPSELLLLRPGRGQAPMPLGLQRLKFWRWMAEDFIGKLGTHAEAFDIEAWVIAQDSKETRAIVGDWWAYWLPAFEAEVRRRGLPLAGAASKEPTQDDLDAQLAIIHRKENLLKEGR